MHALSSPAATTLLGSSAKCVEKRRVVYADVMHPGKLDASVGADVTHVALLGARKPLLLERPSISPERIWTPRKKKGSHHMQPGAEYA